MLDTLRRLSYGWIALQGIAAAAAPKQVVSLSTQLSLCGFENTGELEPKPWYVTAVRAAGIGMIAAGLAGLTLERDESDTDEPVVETAGPGEPDGT
ncbi:MAG: hypothetical protein ABEI98_06725 [Halorhabdus sp.]